MKNKNKLAFLSIALSAAMIFTSCGQKREDESLSNKPDSSVNSITSVVNNSSSDTNTSGPVTSSINTSIPVVNTYTVRFVVEGVTVQTSQVNEGDVAEYTGETPTKASTNPLVKYRFSGWDKDITAPITQDTVFTAVFTTATYQNEVLVDNFETYEDTPSMMDEGWTALTYSNATGTWTNETKAAVSLGSCSFEGNKSLRFDAWENGVGYKIAKIFQTGTYDKSASALNFALKVPSMNTVKVLLHARVSIGGTQQAPSFTYTIKPISSEYVDYSIPLGDDGWALWGEAGKSIKSCAEWMGIHEDDILPYLTRIEFYIEGNDGGSGLPYVAFLDNVHFVYLNEPVYEAIDNQTLFDRYTATLTDGSTLRVDINKTNLTATASVIDLETPLSFTGTVTNENREFTFASSALTFKAEMTNGGQLLKYKSATGAYASLLEDVNLNAVQVVDNFEQYTEDGKAYYQNGPINERSGCRGAYYSEYYNENNTSSSSPWGGNKWSLMGGSGDQLKLKQNQNDAHSGKNYVCMKNSQSNGMRYMQWGLFDGTAEKQSYRGSKMSFWAKTNGVVKSFIAYMYSQSAPTNATRDNYVKKATFTETAAVGEWKHYELDLNPNVVYYGYMIFINANWAADSYLYIDDVEIYTANPYASYQAPEPEKPAELKAGISYIAKISGLIKASIDVQADNKAVLSAPGLEMSVDGSYVIDGKEITFTFGDVTYVVTSENNNSKLAFKSISGSSLVAQALSGTSFEQSSMADDAESYDGAGTMYYQSNTNEDARSGARGAYYCDYYTGSGTSPIGGSGWNLMGGNGDQLTLDATNYYAGKQSLKIKKSTAGAMRYIQWDLFKGTAREIKGVDKFEVYLKNNAASDTVAKICVFTEKQITPSNQTTARIMSEVTLPASQDWTAYTIDLDVNTTYYGYGIILERASETGWVNVDNACFFGPDVDPTINFYAKKDVVLSGEVLPGANASIKFNGNGSASLTCEALGADNAAATYVMSMSGESQNMILTIGDSVITGTYTVTVHGAITFAVLSVSGPLAGQIGGGVTFTNN